MIRTVAAIGAAMLALAASPAFAGEGAQDAAAAGGQKLGACMTLKTTGEDRIVVARWLIGAIASAPQVAGVAVVDPAKKDAGDKAMAALFTRLVTRDCAAEAKPLFAQRGTGQEAFKVAGETLGRVAMQELLGNPAAMQAIGAYAKYISAADFAALMPAPAAK